MNKGTQKPNREELAALLQTRAWDLVTGSESSPVTDRTRSAPHFGFCFSPANDVKK